VNLAEQLERWASRGIAWIVRKLVSQLFRNLPRATAPPRRAEPKVVALYRDPVCGTYVSPEVSFPLEQAGQQLHFCSAACRARYVQSSRRAASA
jgi:YHS domain-containing protein